MRQVSDQRKRKDATNIARPTCLNLTTAKKTDAHTVGQALGAGVIACRAVRLRLLVISRGDTGDRWVTSHAEYGFVAANLFIEFVQCSYPASNAANYGCPRMWQIEFDAPEPARLMPNVPHDGLA
jgi:hypothetical protein